MSKYAISSLLVIFVLVGAFTLQPHKPQADEQAVREVAQWYLEGARHLPSLRRAFADEARLQFIGDEGYQEISFADWYARIAASDNPPPQREETISYVEVAGTAALVKIELGYTDMKITDYLSLLKIEGEWKIVNKIFAREQQ